MRARSGPMPITSTRAPGKRSSASTSVPMPLSITSGPTNSPPERISFMHYPPATVFNLRYALGLLRRFGFEDLDAQLAGARFFLRRFGFALLLAAAPAQPSRGVEVSGSSSSSTHFDLSPCFTPASTPSGFAPASSTPRSRGRRGRAPPPRASGRG